MSLLLKSRRNGSYLFVGKAGKSKIQSGQIVGNSPTRGIIGTQTKRIGRLSNMTGNSSKVALAWRSSFDGCWRIRKKMILLRLRHA
jgi:hypothetical protein